MWEEPPLPQHAHNFSPHCSQPYSKLLNGKNDIEFSQIAHKLAGKKDHNTGSGWTKGVL